MASSATIYNAHLDIADSDSNYYKSVKLTLALHPSEQLQRMIARLLAWCCHANEEMQFGRGISTPEDATLWQQDINGHILHWVEVGEPDPDLLRKAALKADRISLYCYGKEWSQWWQRQQKVLARQKKLHVWHLPWESINTLAQDLPRTFRWQLSISEGEFFITDHRAQSISLRPELLLETGHH